MRKRKRFLVKNIYLHHWSKIIYKWTQKICKVLSRQIFTMKFHLTLTAVSKHQKAIDKGMEI